LRGDSVCLREKLHMNARLTLIGYRDGAVWIGKSKAFVNLLAPELFFFKFSTSLYKM